ncbi:nitroreductase [Streptomyces sioyaensis]|uniref:nitroreductase family protein n=1 Tax=Streptomyces sioyaensis TaxID=67364 RepID=UPI0036C6CFCD
MDIMEGIRTRRSVTRLAEPAIADAELLDLLNAAMTAPDHGRLTPWRLITLRGEERATLGRALAEAAGAAGPVASRQAAVRPFLAPLLITIVFCPVDHPRVPQWEQLAATTAVVHNLTLLLHGYGYGSIWRTGGVTEEPCVRRALGLRDHEQLLGWLYVGTAAGPCPPRPSREPERQLSSLTQLTGNAAWHGLGGQDTWAPTRSLQEH